MASARRPAPSATTARRAHSAAGSVATPAAFRCSWAIGHSCAAAAARAIDRCTRGGGPGFTVELPEHRVTLPQGLGGVAGQGVRVHRRDPRGDRQVGVLGQRHRLFDQAVPEWTAPRLIASCPARR